MKPKQAKYPNYEACAQDCAAFLRSAYPGSLKIRTINGVDMWIWENGDNPPHIFAFETEEQAAADLCLEMGVTASELDSGKVA